MLDRCGRTPEKGKMMAATPPETLSIEREEGDSKGRYVARLEALRGRSVGQALVRRAVEDARAEGRSIVPLGPFAKARIARHPEWQDVLKH
ncbi:GNAT family N-acetyltransferase [Limimaricola cinnabarinus]|uniref:GNAT family N-acetyltransferase n=1 Tax=Limimaricola cinnabarinus TaxID=1125964 RepID=UPI002FE06DF3